MSRTTGPIVLLAALVALAVPTAASASAYEADPTGYARGSIVPAALTAPPAFAPIGIVDDVVDAGVADVSQVQVLKGSPGKALDLKAGFTACAPTPRAEAAGACPAHGTEVASVAAGRADGQGVIGVAAGAPLLSWGYRTLSCTEVANGILALADAGAKIINLSMEADEPCARMRRAIGAVHGNGVLVVASAGNERKADDPTIYPAAYPHVLTIGAIGLDRGPDADSSTGPWVDLAAPGEAIPVALPSALDRDGTADGLTRKDGTSFAAPMVSGAASWLVAARPGLSPSQYAGLLRGTAKAVGGAGWNARTGFGTVDLAAALAAPVPAADRGEPNDEVAEVDGSVFDKPDAYVSGTVKASAAPAEDPLDIYRVRVKARSAKTVKLTTTAKGLALSGFLGKQRVASGPKTIKLRNATGKSQAFYAVVRASGARVAASLAYTLKVG